MYKTLALMLTLGFSLPSPAVADQLPSHAPEVGITIEHTEPLKPLPQTVATPLEPLQPIAESAPAPVVAPVAAAPSSPVSGCGDNEMAHFIYMHESGCVTDKYNSIGCYGIGQECGHESDPLHPFTCGADYTCQNAWFTDYANRAYGGWAGAYSFWQSHSWW